MQLLVSHVLVGVVFAVVGLCAGWWLCQHWPSAQLLTGVDDAQLARELMTSLHRLSVRMAADVGEHSARVGEVDQELTTQPHATSASLTALADRLLKANEVMQTKLSQAESKLDELHDRMEFHAAEARTDVLTGMPNRRAFEEAARQLLASQETGTELSLVMIDIDRFKRVNDQLGHPQGDKVLRRIGSTLLAHSPWQHLVSRYGGEEFAILMPNTTWEDARVQAERLRIAVHETQYRVGTSVLNMTISAGVAQLMEAETMESLIQRTDRAMYGAKHAGRDCVCWHDGFRVRVWKAAAQGGSASDGQTHRPASSAAPPPTPIELSEQCGMSIDESGPHAMADIDLCTPENVDLDLLHNLNNKTMFCQQVHRRICEFNRGGAPFSTMLLSVDNYAHLVHEHGVPTAELALGVVVQAIRDRVRNMDMVAKYDESTFGLILPGALLRHAVCIGERLRKEIHQVGIMVNGQPVSFTVSLGVVEVLDGDEMAAHVERACAQLAQASRRGGNRTGFTPSIAS